MFSVEIPAYNCGLTIKRVFDSVENQTRFDLIEEIIVVNDGSTGKPDQAVTEYIHTHPRPMDGTKTGTPGTSFEKIP